MPESYTTEAWVLHQGAREGSRPGELVRESFAFDAPGPEEVLAEPLFGSWEANMSHALARHPVDVCRLRCEEKVVLGNSGVVRVLEVGEAVDNASPGDVCMLAPFGELDDYGYMKRVFGYDAPRTVGLLARLTKLHRNQLVKLPAPSRFPLERWAAASVRYATAWDNWRVAWGCYRLQMSDEDSPTPWVWSWGGGVGLATLLLAKRQGCKTAMIASHDERLQLLAELGITPVDRREFPNLDYDPERFANDPDFRRIYLDSERRFLIEVRRKTGGERASIFVDNIGRPVLRATLKALARQGVLTSTGWDRGGDMAYDRITECTKRHIFVHTHGGRLSAARATVRYAEETGWLPPVPPQTWAWDDIPELARRFARGELSTYFPVFRVQPGDHHAGQPGFDPGTTSSRETSP